MIKIVSKFSKAIQKSQSIIKQMRQNKHYIDEPIVSQKQEAQKIVEQLYFTPKKDKFQLEHEQQEQRKENNQLQQENEINLRKYQTAQELLEFYETTPFTSPQYFVDWFNQICYCIKYQDQIQENKLKYYKRMAGQYKAQFNKEYQIPQIIYLTPSQIIQTPIFNQILEDFVTYSDQSQQVQVRKQLTKTFQMVIYPLDFYVLQRIEEENEHPISTIQYLSLLIKDLSEGKFEKTQEPPFLELFDGKISQGQSLKTAIEQLLLQKMQKIKFQGLNNEDLTDFIFIYYQQQKMSILPSFIQELVNHIKERVSQLSILQNVKICQTILALQIGDSQLYTYLLWNIIRLQNKINKNKQTIDGILFILMHFRQNILFFKQPKYYSQPILVRDIMIFPEIFNIITADISEYNYVQLNQLLIIAYQNFAVQMKFDAIIAALFKQPQAYDKIQINQKIDSLYKATQAGNQKLDVSQVLKNKALSLSSHTVQGFFEKQKDSSKSEIIVFQSYYSQEISNLVRIVWTSIVQNSKNFEDLNYLILKINELTKLNTIIKIDRNIQKLMSQINQYIALRGKSMFPNKIDFQQIIGNNLIFRKQESYQHPLKLHTKLFVKEKQYFSKKYAENLQKDVIYQDMLFDYVYTNPETGDQALILLNSQNQYFISETGEMVPNTQIAFQQSLLEEGDIPAVQINLPSLIKEQNGSFYEKQLQEILGTGSAEYENIMDQITDLRQNLAKDFNYISSLQQNEEIKTNKIQDTEEKLSNDTYELSDEEIETKKQ